MCHTFNFYLPVCHSVHLSCFRPLIGGSHRWKGPLCPWINYVCFSLFYFLLCPRVLPRRTNERNLARPPSSARRRRPDPAAPSHPRPPSPRAPGRRHSLVPRPAFPRSQDAAHGGSSRRKRGTAGSRKGHGRGRVEGREQSNAIERKQGKGKLKSGQARRESSRTNEARTWTHSWTCCFFNSTQIFLIFNAFFKKITCFLIFYAFINLFQLFYFFYGF